MVLNINKMNIDFDAAHKAWMLNKEKTSQGQYKYICTAYTLKGEPCKKKPCTHCNYCHIHKKNINNNKNKFLNRS